LRNKDNIRGDVQALKQTISSLKSKLNQKDKKISRLLTDLKTLQQGFDSSIVYVNDELSDIPVEDVVRYFNNKNKPKVSEIKKSQETPLQELKDKWNCHKCGSGYLKLIIMSRPDGKKYFRCCSNGKCKNRTDVKNWSPEIQGVTA